VKRFVASSMSAPCVFVFFMMLVAAASEECHVDAAVLVQHRQDWAKWNTATFLKDKPISTIVYVHIPKTGGRSFESDARKIFAPIGVIENLENCFKVTEFQWRSSKTKMLAVLFRSPMQHVLSQFLWCKQWWHLFSNTTGTYGGLDEWVFHHEQERRKPLPSTKDFNFNYWQESAYKCYSPWNMQTRYFTQQHHHIKDCPQGFNNYSCHMVQENFEPSPDVAKDVLDRQVDLFGITDLYVETLCLMQWKMNGTIPHSCACGGQGLSEQYTHNDHGVAAHRIEDLPKNIRQQMAKFVQQDARFFGFVLDRFEKELKKVATVTGIQMVCPDRFKKIRDEIAWVHQYAA